MDSAMHVFDRRAVRLHRDRAAGASGDADFLFREVAGRLADRLADIRRCFPVACELGSRGPSLADTLDRRGGIETIVALAPALDGKAGAKSARRLVVADEEALPLAAGSVDLVLSGLALHWVNDLPGTLLQVRLALKPDGLFLAALFGGDTLLELRRAWMEAELAEEGGAGPRVSPLVDVRDAGALLQRAGFALPVADVDRLTVTYADAFALMRDLRAMGESNAVAARRRGFTRRATLLRMAEAYHDLFGRADGRVPATFEVVYLTGWAPHDSQQRALRPGGARTRLADALGAAERPAGDKARP